MDVDVTGELHDFLARIDLTMYGPCMAKLGYGCVDAFEKFDAGSLARLRKALAEETERHINTIVDAVAKRSNSNAHEPQPAGAMTDDAVHDEQPTSSLPLPAVSAPVAASAPATGGDGAAAAVPVPSPAPAISEPGAESEDAEAAAAAAAAATAAMLQAAAAAAAAPIEFQEPAVEIDEEAAYLQGEQFGLAFIEYCRQNPGAAGASAAAVYLIQALAIVAAAMEEDPDEGEEEEGEEEYDDEIAIDDDNWRP